ncbi:MAG: hypothetical protein RIQ89_1457 [Bacteroidota bacterium]
MALCLLVNLGVSAQTEKIKWYTFSEAVTLNQTSPKKIFIDVYTQWCGWCKRMDQTTFTDPKIVSAMNKDYYAVKIDAEMRDTIIFNAHTFVYKPEFKSHELALSLLERQMSYPSFVILDEQLGKITPLAGYQTVEQLSPILNYIGSNSYKTKNYEEYLKQ